jgi:hypothetical protein
VAGSRYSGPAANISASVSEAEQPERLIRGRASADDIRALAGPATPHFALQIRNRIRRLVADLPADDPARVEGERQIARLEDLARHSGEPRGRRSVTG